MKRNEVLVYVTGAFFVYCLSTCTADKNELINYNNTNITCGNLTCYGPFTVECNLTVPKPCECLVGFEGDECLHDIDECGPGHLPCGGAGFCTNGLGDFTCNCTKGWSGDHCRNKSGGPFECIPGWTGDICRTDIDECKNEALFTCPVNQRCKNTRGNYTCICDDGWTGLDCLQDIDECSLSFCPNAMNCTNTNGSYKCICPPDKSGKNCSMQNFCFTSHCLNGATCINEQTEAKCLCQHGWTGEKCERDIDECLTSSCLHNGNCTNTNGSFLCRCKIGWTGLTCQEDVNECLNASICMYGSRCINNDGSYSCLCLSGFEGWNCETDIDECLSAPCLNNGTCNNTMGSFNCACANNYTGTTCEKEPFSDNGNGGTNTPVIVGSVLGSVAGVGAAVSGVFLYKKLSLLRSRKPHNKIASDDLNQGHKAEEKPTMPGQTKFQVT